MNRFAALIGAVSLGLVAAVPAHAAFPEHAKVVRKKDDDRVRFVSTPRGRPMARPGGHSANADARDVGRAFLEENARDFGLTGSAVSATRRIPDVAGGSAVRYQQRIRGVKVLGGQFVVRLDEENRILTAQGEAEPDSAVDTEPVLAASDAEGRAVQAVARHEGVHAARLETSGTELMIFNDRLVGGPGPDRAALVWATHVADRMAVRKLVLVDADTGAIAAEIEEAPEAKNRSICDAGNTPAQLPCTAPVLTEGATYGGSVPDVQPAYTYSGGFYDFLKNRFDRDSLDGAGMPLKSTVRYCDPDASCPFANAFWNGEQMVYGQGYAVADDVVGHELAHGYTDHTSGLLYYFQSGAINESMSDVFGELFDIGQASPGDAPADAWKMGESLPDGGAIRNMADPGLFGDPDHMLSANWFLDPNMDDSGGVHFNSGVGNKAAYLIVAGGSFNSETVTGIGADKAAQIYNRVQTSFLTSGSDYVDLGLALGAACDGLVGTHGIVAADCVEVRDAVRATKMLTDRPEAPDAAECITGAPVYAYDESFEGPGIAWDTTPVNGEPSWGLIGDYAATGERSLYTPNRSGTGGTTSAYMTQSLAIPSGAFLSFQTAWEFEPPNYDGGLVEVSTNGGSTWSQLAVPGYNGTLAAFDGNPLAGRSGFVGRSNGYRRMVTSLASLAGTSARFRFVYGHDASIAQGIGWVVDDVRVHTCAAQEKPTVATATPAVVFQTSATLKGVVNPNGSATTYRFEYGPNGTFSQSTPVANAGSGSGPVNVEAPVSGLTAATSYSFRLVATNAAGSATSSAGTFTTPAATTETPPQDATPPAPVVPVTPVTPVTELPTRLAGTARPVKRGRTAAVACTNSAGRVTCRVTFRTARRARRVSAILRSGSTVAAKGSVRRANRRGQVTLTGRAALTAGSYTLTVKIGRKSYRFRLALK